MKRTHHYNTMIKNKKIFFKMLIPLTATAIILSASLPLVSCSSGDNTPPPIVVTHLIDGSNWEGCSSGTLRYTTNTLVPGNYTVTYVGNNNYEASNLVIPDVVTYQGETYRVIAMDCESGTNAGVFQNCTTITGTLTIGNNVTSIGNNAFSGCTGLTGGLAIPNNVTTIGNAAFKGCSSLNGRLTIGNNVTSVGNSAFEDCSGLTGLTFPNSVTTIGNNVFWKCSNLTYSNVALPSGTFGNYNGFDTGTTKFITKSIAPGRDVIAGSLAFGTLDATVFGLMNVSSTIAEGAFQNCTSLTCNSLTIPASVLTIEYSAFENCTGLGGELTFGIRLTTINTNAFNNCSNFFSIVGNFQGNPTVENKAFYGWAQSGGTVFNANPSYSRTALFSKLKNDGNLPNTWSVKPYHINGDDWEGHTQGDIPWTIDSVTGGVKYGNASGDYRATNLVIPDFVTDGTSTYKVTGITNTFFHSSPNSPTLYGTLTIGNFVTSIDTSAFQYQNSLTGSLNIPPNVTSLGNSAFYHCTGFSGNLGLGGVATIGPNAFGGDTGFDGQLKLPTTVTTIDEAAFDGCTGFDSLNFQNANITTIGPYAFRGCSSFSGVLTIPNAVTEIKEYAFDWCSSFGSIVGNFDREPTVEIGAFRNWANSGEVFNQSYSYDAQHLLDLLQENPGPSLPAGWTVG